LSCEHFLFLSDYRHQGLLVLFNLKNTCPDLTCGKLPGICATVSEMTMLSCEPGTVPLVVEGVVASATASAARCVADVAVWLAI
jgi:hypothetical protein